MTFQEQALVFDCAGARLVGVLAQPQQPRPLAVLVVVGGPQYRVGSHRQFVQMSRRLATAGYPVLRFDVRGMGDSEGAPRTFEALDDDIAAAAQALLERQPPGTRLVLWGLCDGASAALLYLDRRADARVAGLALLNPWVRSEASLARTQVKHYYGQRLLQRTFWLKLLRGGIGWSALAAFVRSLRSSAASANSGADPDLDYRTRMARAWHRFDGSILLLLSESDYTAREFEVCAATEGPWQGALSRMGIRICRLAEADHTLSSSPVKVQADAELRTWLDSLVQAGRSTAS